MYLRWRKLTERSENNPSAFAFYGGRDDGAKGKKYWLNYVQVAISLKQLYREIIITFYCPLSVNDVFLTALWTYCKPNRFQ